MIPQNVKPVLRIIFIIIATIGFSSVWFITVLNLYLLNKKKKVKFMLSLNPLIYFLNVYFVNGPAIQIYYYIRHNVTTEKSILDIQ